MIIQYIAIPFVCVPFTACKAGERAELAEQPTKVFCMLRITQSILFQTGRQNLFVAHGGLTYLWFLCWWIVLHKQVLLVHVLEFGMRDGYYI